MRPTEAGHRRYKLLVKKFRFDLVKPRSYGYDAEAASKRRLARVEGVGEPRPSGRGGGRGKLKRRS